MTDRLLTKKEVREICGGISEATFWRWRRDPEVKFPDAISFGGKTFWRQTAINAWFETLGGEARA